MTHLCVSKTSGLFWKPDLHHWECWEQICFQHPKVCSDAYKCLTSWSPSLTLLDPIPRCSGLDVKPLSVLCSACGLSAKSSSKRGNLKCWAFWHEHLPTKMRWNQWTHFLSPRFLCMVAVSEITELGWIQTGKLHKLCNGFPFHLSRKKLSKVVLPKSELTSASLPLLRHISGPSTTPGMTHGEPAIYKTNPSS